VAVRASQRGRSFAISAALSISKVKNFRVRPGRAVLTQVCADGCDDGGGAEFLLAATIERAFFEEAGGAFDFLPDHAVLFAQGATPFRVIRAEQGDRGGANMRTQMTKAGVGGDSEGGTAEQGQGGGDGG